VFFLALVIVATNVREKTTFPVAETFSYTPCSHRCADFCWPGNESLCIFMECFPFKTAEAAHKGDLYLLQTLWANGCSWDESTCSEAARGGHREVLHWARANGCPWDERTCSEAAGGGYLEILKWARANGCPWDERTCSEAARGGHLDVLQWASVNGCSWDETTCSAAACGGYLEILQWARANGCPWNERTCYAAASGGHLNVLQWAMANGCSWADFICTVAMNCSEWAILQWAVKHGVKHDPNRHHYRSDDQHQFYAARQWLQEHWLRNYDYYERWGGYIREWLEQITDSRTLLNQLLLPDLATLVIQYA